MSRLHIFDMDGTLLQGTTASLEIARRLGCTPDLLHLESAFAAGTMDARGFAAEICQLWQNLTPALAQEAFEQAPWIGGLEEVLADIRDRGERSAVITMSPDFFAGQLVGLGVDEVVASGFPSLPLRELPDPLRILTPADKVTAADRILAGLGLGRDSCVAYGDSGSDIPLFQTLPHTVAVNATSTLRALARHDYQGDDLRDAYRIVRSPASSFKSRGTEAAANRLADDVVGLPARRRFRDYLVRPTCRLPPPLSPVRLSRAAAPPDAGPPSGRCLVRSRPGITAHVGQPLSADAVPLVLVGGDIPFCPQRERRVDLELVETLALSPGVAYRCYRVARQPAGGPAAS